MKKGQNHTERSGGVYLKHEKQKAQWIPLKQAASMMKRMAGKEKGEVCRRCGYRMRHLHGDECPMCKTCQGCGKSLMQCHCHEGE